MTPMPSTWSPTPKTAIGMRSVALAALLALATPAGAEGMGTFLTVAVDFPALAGTWHEIARFPNRFQRRCDVAFTAYAPRPDGQLEVQGRCANWPAERSSLTGVARIDGAGELSIGAFSWLPFLRRSVHVLHLDLRHGTAVVGEPRRKYGWIIARGARIDAQAFTEARDVLVRNGYDVTLLERVDQR